MDVNEKGINSKTEKMICLILTKYINNIAYMTPDALDTHTRTHTHIHTYMIILYFYIHTYIYDYSLFLTHNLTAKSILSKK